MSDAILVFPHQVSGALAMWAIRQSPYPCPDNLETVVRLFAELFPRGDEGLAGMVEFASFDALYHAIQTTSEQIPELLAWNERKNGNTYPLGFSSRYDKPEPDNDFIDLHALWGNVARSVFEKNAICRSWCHEPGSRPARHSHASGMAALLVCRESNVSSLATELPREINRVREVQDQYKELRGMPNVMVEPQIAMMERDIQAAIHASSTGDVIGMLRAYEQLKGYSA